ncbi:hypothetical protein JR316_0001366 [Psilocybe cubensis]|uniref:Uncharacterized protein n=2 Tax=Psilocybe cubensis TaxID=181762 RepID=A0ACB8HH80_PSICU|nr:hypothetical protein JR316_0001366 [Psilocybe cubensis]KAH9487296.1 hypothetical protein JR316_0001366 [Psilocybe cubensis]
MTSQPLLRAQKASESETYGSSITANVNSNLPRDTSQSIRWIEPETHEFRSQIASGMDNEFVECSVDIFLKHYLPFEPSDEAVETCIAKLLCKPFSFVDGVSGANPRSEQVPEKPRRSTCVKTLPQPSCIERHPILSVVKFKEQKEPTTCDAETTVLRFTNYMMRPGRQSLGNKSVFAQLKSIADAVGGHSETCDGRVRNDFHYLNCPDAVISSNIGGFKNKIDACFSNGGSDLNVKNIAVPIEQQAWVASKYFTSDRQVVSANVQIMNDDVRRMFTYGMTFEGDKATLWYHCRSHSAVSKQFSFVENPRLLVKVFLSFLFATDEELGYDTNVTAVEGKKRQYIFKIPSSDGKSAKFYRTLKVLSEYPSNNISGRMARVWLVDRVDSDGNKIGPPCVLKDVWLSINALTEKEIQTAIFADIEKYCHPDKPDYNLALDPPTRSPQAALNAIKMRNAELVESGEYKQYFLDIESDYSGKPSKDVLEGCTPDMGLFHSAHANRIASLNNISIPSVGSTGFSKTRRSSIRTYTPRKQYRVIFKEVCQAVGDLPTLGKVVNVLKQTVIPLSLLYCANWVHRDISSGNILAHQQGSVFRAKLSDLEYAKKFPPPADHQGNADAKTGTPFFMPVEIMQNCYLYGKPKADNVDSRIEDPVILLAEMQRVEHGAMNDKVWTKIPSYEAVIYNFQHDLESLWWVLVWSLTARVNHQPSRTWANQIFQHADVPTSERVKFLRPFDEKDLDTNTKAQDPLQATMLPSISFLNYIVNILKDALHVAYSEHTSNAILREPLSYAIVVNRFYLGFQLFDRVAGAPWEETPLVMNIPAEGPDTVQPVDTNTAVSSAPSLIPHQKGSNPNIRKTAPSESFQPGSGDEDVKPTIEQQRSKRFKNQDDSITSSLMTGRQSKSSTRSKA